MLNDTRVKFEGYLAQVAKLNAVASALQKFSVAPAVQQKLEKKIQQSSAFLSSINVIGVTNQEGEKLGLGVGSTVASTTDTSKNKRNTTDISNIELVNKYRCEQTNFDWHIGYGKLDAWAEQPEFQTMLAEAIAQRQALDRVMIGWNGIARAATSDRAAHPLLQDVNKGWLQQIRENAPQRVMSHGSLAADKIKVGAGGDYENLDALVFDLVNEFLDEWHQEDTGLVVICGRRLLADKYFPIINQQQANTEKLAADMIVSQKRIGNLPAVRVPNFPANGLLVTRLDNLSVYFQKGARRRQVKEASEWDRVENYESSNEAYVVEDYGMTALAENIELLPVPKA
ncbi:phage major capsid protein, P2 family [Pseudoduganella sp. FT55W]|uniref:Phage major capsid protein, P2 family n=1 Tax=Duganella rivi TaxID=2666083 RepID=A0A7X4KEZ6_9BURK|nr:phage major capsid protein, P2 family [Duganella rivi]MYM70522.1 phage major capsid protein, P2 family [Duganella rivi]